MFVCPGICRLDAPWTRKRLTYRKLALALDPRGPSSEAVSAAEVVNQANGIWVGARETGIIRACLRADGRTVVLQYGERRRRCTHGGVLLDT